MGWSYGYHQARDVQEQIEKHEGLFTTSTPGHSYEILDRAIVGSTYYAAVRRTTPDHPPYVFAAVILFKNPRSGFGYKDMDESVDPCEVACPLRILNLLSPLEDMPGGAERYEYAGAWRERVRAYHQARKTQSRAGRALRNGDKIKLPEPLSFGKGAFTEDTFRVESYYCRGHERRCYRAMTQNCLVAIPHRLVEHAVKVEG